MNNPPDISLINRIEQGLTRCKGKRLAITAPKIMAKLRDEGHNINKAKFMECIHYLRTIRGMFICADNSGYYTPATADEMERQIASMRSRIREITEAHDALVKAYKGEFKQSEIDV